MCYFKQYLLSAYVGQTNGRTQGGSNWAEDRMHVHKMIPQYVRSHTRRLGRSRVEVVWEQIPDGGDKTMGSFSDWEEFEKLASVRIGLGLPHFIFFYLPDSLRKQPGWTQLHFFKGLLTGVTGQFSSKEGGQLWALATEEEKFSLPLVLLLYSHMTTTLWTLLIADV